MKNKPSALSNSRHKSSNSKENLTERITFRLSSAEREQLIQKAETRGIRLSLLCRLIVMRRKIPDRSEQTRQWLRDLVGMQNNINQLARYVNTIKGLDDWATEALRFISSEIRNAKNTLINTNNDHEDEQSI